jgi:hypothetical protein|tara:strand:+ start:381 stop:590 length:210 start_codon:yes stop_codon:yes gene_type:complete
MELLIQADGVFTLVEVTKDMLKHIKIVSDVDCFSLCDIIRIEFTEYLDAPHNLHMMKDGSGYFYGCICR